MTVARNLLCDDEMFRDVATLQQLQGRLGAGLLGQVVGAGSPLSSTDTPGNCSFARGGQPIALPGLQNLVHMAMTVERMGTKSASNVLSKLQNPKKMFTSYFFLALLVISP